MSTIGWKLNRLRCMGAAEIIHRISNGLRATLEARGYGIAAQPPAPTTASSAMPWVDPLPLAFEQTKNQYLARADSILAGRFRVFALDPAVLGFPPDWNTDPKTGRKAPLTFGKTLDYRDGESVGDIKYLWEPNRHIELVVLAQAWHLSGDRAYLQGAKTLLDSWFEQCPYPLGINWTSSLEISIRLLNWSFAWYLLGGEESSMFGDPAGAAFRRRWLDSIYQHCFFVSKHFSRYSSANNHLFGEYVGLFAGAVTWPMWQESTAWRVMAKQGLEAETGVQIGNDGVNREQAIWYQHEVADMMLFAGLMGRANGIEFSAGFWAKLNAMLDYIASVMDVSGNVPMIGDSDDAVMIEFAPERDVYRSLLATGAVLFSRGDLKAKASRFDDKSRWLLGDEAAARFKALDANAESELPKRRFPEAGYYVLGKNLDSETEIRLVADAGSLGFLSIAAHGHADALAFTLSVGGNEILIDPGTYAYHAGEFWRDYFRGTSAHNTVRVDGRDQSVAGGKFLWLKHAEAKCSEFIVSDEQDYWAGEHDGYHRLSDPVTHQRSVCLNKLKNEIHVDDTLLCQQQHLIEIHWHLSEHCTAQVEGSNIHIHNGSIQVAMRMPDAAWTPEIVCGSEDLPLGWVSRAFDRKKPIPSIRWSGEIYGTTRLQTIIAIDKEKC